MHKLLPRIALVLLPALALAVLTAPTAVHAQDNCFADGRLNACDADATVIPYCREEGIEVFELAPDGNGRDAFRVTYPEIAIGMSRALETRSPYLIDAGRTSALYALPNSQLQVLSFFGNVAGDSFTFRANACGPIDYDIYLLQGLFDLDQEIEELEDEFDEFVEEVNPSGSSSGNAQFFSSAPQGGSTHTVRAGENLFRIGLAYGCSVGEMSSANGLADPTRIFAGQVLTVPAC